METDASDWKSFEEAISRFIDALGTGAKVTHDARLPDIHTGHPRQRDVWVEWKVGGLFPVKALVSCKYWSEPLNQQDIDHFNGEFISSGAHVAVIYSRAGFNDHAIEKAKALRFHCCRLYQDEPADMPQSLLFGMSYHIRPKTCRLHIEGEYQCYGFKTWQDVLDLVVNGSTIRQLLIKEIDRKGSDKSSELKKNLSESFATVQVRDTLMRPFDLSFIWDYAAYEAKTEYVLVNGTYNITAKSFAGSQSTPGIDTRNYHPGQGWNEIVELPECLSNATFIAFQLDAVENLSRFDNVSIVGNYRN